MWEGFCYILVVYEFIKYVSYILTVLLALCVLFADRPWLMAKRAEH